ncbi:MAG: cell division topological specificity factor MinE [Lachnospirales bacterium]
MELIKYDIFKAVSKYIKISEDSIKITFDDYRNSDLKSGIKLNATIDLSNISNR